MRWTSSKPVHHAAMVAVATRPVVFLAGYLAVFMFGYAPGAQPFEDFDSELLNLPLRWDAGWYLQMAREGYEYTRARPGGQQNIVFFPAFPLRSGPLRCCSATTIPRTSSARTAVSLLLFVLGMTYLHRLAREFLTRRRVSDGALDAGGVPVRALLRRDLHGSLFLVGTAGAFYHFRRDELVTRGAVGIRSWG